VNELLYPNARRSILDLLADIGGEHNHEELALLLNQMGHRMARREVIEQLAWLANAKLILVEELGQYCVARILSDGRDVADGRWIVAGVSKFKSGE
jgi:Fe2+ or Zn2+ uptake regulation protein